QPFDLGQYSMKRVLECLHEGPSLGIHDCQWRQAVARKNDTALAGCACRIIQWPDEAFLFLEQFGHFLLIPKVVAAGDDVHARRENLLSGLDGDPGAAGGVFAIDHDDIERMAFSQSRQQLLDRPTSRLRDDIRNEEQVHCSTVTALWKRANPFKCNAERRVQNDGKWLRGTRVESEAR